MPIKCPVASLTLEKIGVIDVGVEVEVAEIGGVGSVSEVML